MRSIDTWLDRFCYRHPRFGIPHLINYIIFGNVIVYVLDMFSSGMASALLGLDFGAAVLNLQLWRLVTFIFVPEASRPIWFVVAMFFYYFLGNTMEESWGTAKFTLFYLCGAVLTFLASIVTYFWTGGTMGYMISLGSAHETLFLAFATLYPDAQIRVYFILPVKAKWLAGFYVFLQVWNIVSMNRLFLPILLPVLLPMLIAAWVNYAIFFWSDISRLFRRANARRRHQASAQTVNFRKATQQAQQKKGYIHKCAVCGKTDTDYPDLEFRYCSKCNGYYCYCREHINNHVHIQ